MKEPWSVTFGLWLQQFAFLHRWLLRYSHDFGGKRWYVNRVSGTTFGKPRPIPAAQGSAE